MANYNESSDNRLFDKNIKEFRKIRKRILWRRQIEEENNFAT